MTREKSRSPTIAEVAQAANVARSTVSRAFARPERLSEKTVEHVRAVAERLGFTPNPLARALSTGQSKIIGLIVPDIANPFFPPLIRAAQRRAEEGGFDVFLGDFDEDSEREDKLVRRFSQQVAGLVLVSSRLTDAQIAEHSRRKPLVLINKDLPEHPARPDRQRDGHFRGRRSSCRARASQARLCRRPGAVVGAAAAQHHAAPGRVAAGARPHDARDFQADARGRQGCR